MKPTNYGKEAINDHLLVTIIINNYNYENFVGVAINSALKQTYNNCEVLVVDDGSTDGSRTVISSFGGKIKAIYKKNAGQIMAFNDAFCQSNGEIVLVLDSDDYLKSTAVQSIVSEWETGLSKVQFQLATVDEFGIPTGRVFPNFSRKYQGNRILDELLQTANYTSPPSSGNAYSRTYLESVSPLNNDLGIPRHASDAVLTIGAPLFGRIKSLDQVLGYYRVHAGNQDSSFRSRNFHLLCVKEVARCRYLRDLAIKSKYEIREDLYRWSPKFGIFRLMSFRTDPVNHIFENDNRFKIIVDAIQGTVHTSMPIRWKFTIASLLCCLAVLPKHTAIRLFDARYDRRPKWMSTLLRLFGVVKKSPESDSSLYGYNKDANYR